ncbi:hypothetical protein NHH88_15350 [Oxalobacteraceae bacterium OTU3CAMAD1]|nr:hypothetical protein NHH88_15350 [Oxalobacteraceae bacterium OTU3CAMAD1]
MIETHTAPQVLHRAGVVLLVVGAIDIAYMIWRLSTGASYSYSMTIPAVIVGVLLMRGSLKAASALIWIAAILLPMALASGAMSLMQPLDLTLTELRLAPAAHFGAALPLLIFCGLLYWLLQQLGRQPVQSAIQTTGRKKPAINVALTIGVALSMLALTGKQLGQNSDLKKKAEQLAQEKHGAQFRYHASSITPRDDMEGTFVEAKVQAWNQNSVDTVDVFWKEK